MINTSYFKIQDAIEQYGLKNLRILMPATPVDFSFFVMTGVPLTLQSSDQKEVWAEYNIKECDPHHKISLVPSEKYEISISTYGQETGKSNIFPNERKYVTDFNNLVRSGWARIYLETEDGYQLVFGVFEDVYNNNEIKALEWIKNIFNQQRFEAFA